ncbi:unnamed protein product, partial [Mesorhabditis belari]|uniref:Glycolipid transfer protein domain-containing protein n=1 Tax=Mesorhabditis belari TaxID=2138241 RepID=A0AAF3FC08_9BILA
MEVTVNRPLSTEIAADDTAALKATVSELAFDVEKVADLFEKAIVAEHDSDVTLPLFVAAYEELNKFIGMLGKIFHFVQVDIRSKTTRLRELNKKEPEKYDSVDALFAHEVTSKNYQGAKSLLALHRALQFIVDFMEALASANNDSSVAEICRLSYGRTLAKHHGWAIRQAVSLAAYTLPSRKNLILCVVEEPPSEEFVKKAILRVVESGKSVFERVSIYYEKHGLHQLI